jgi:molybdopterin converting factor small subunit
VRNIAAAEERFGSAFAQVVATSNIWLNGDDDVAPSTTVGDDDEVAVIPPVSGR